MKCQNCGVNFDDEERVCPVCGYAAGKKGRMNSGAKRYTDYTHTVHDPEQCTHETFTRETDYTGQAKRQTSSPRPQPTRSQPLRPQRPTNDAKKARAITNVIVTIVVLLGLLGGLLQSCMSSMQEWGRSMMGFADTYESDYGAQTDSEYDSEYEARPITFYLPEGRYSGVLSGREFYLTVQEDDTFRISVTDGDFTVSGEGTAMAKFLSDESYFDSTMYPYLDNYGYLIELYFDSIECSQDEQIPDLKEDMNAWFSLYENIETGELAFVDDWDDPACTDLFHATTEIPLQRLTES